MMYSVKAYLSVNNLRSRNFSFSLYVYILNPEEASMKKVWNLLFFVFVILCLFLLKPRQDVIFGAVSESQYIRLFEEGRDFQFSLEENSTYTGTYALSSDTITLYYKQKVDLSTNQIIPLLREDIIALPVKLYIDKNSSEIRSADKRIFTAEVYIDLRKDVYKSYADRPGILNTARAKISDLKTGP